MKTATLTFHCAHNYGAVLQAYALQNNIANNNIDNKILNYLPIELTQPYEIKIYKKPFNFKRVICNLIGYNYRKGKFYKFEDFIKKRLKTTDCIYNEKQLTNEMKKYDAIIVGSDQVWNPEIAKGKAYYLGNINNVKKVSYAASFGISNLSEKDSTRLSPMIADFDFISVRENEGTDIVRNLINKEVVQVLDPVFLLSKEEWFEISNKEFADKFDKYILCYSMEENEKMTKIVREIAKIKKSKVIYINPDTRLKTIFSKSKKDFINLNNVGPEEFLSLINNAQLVVTNSFHGTAFSIIMEKDFLSIAHKTRNGRLKSLLEILNLEKHMVNDFNLSIDEILGKSKGEPIKYKKRLNEEIKKSKNFIKKIFE